MYSIKKTERKEKDANNFNSVSNCTEKNLIFSFVECVEAFIIIFWNGVHNGSV